MIVYVVVEIVGDGVRVLQAFFFVVNERVVLSLSQEGGVEMGVDDGDTR